MKAGRLFVNVGAMLALSVGQRALGLVVVFVLARVLDPRGLGAYTFAQSTAVTSYGLLRVGADAGLHVTIASHHQPEQSLYVSRLLGEMMTVFAVLAGLAIIGLAIFDHLIAVHLFGDPALAPYVLASTVTLVGLVVCQYCYAAFAGLQALLGYARLAAIGTLLITTLTIWGGVTYGAPGAAWSAAAGQCGMACLLFLGLLVECARRGLHLRPKSPTRVTAAAVSIGLPLYLGGLFLIPAEFLSLGYLSQFDGLSSLGELRIVQALMTAAAVVPSAFTMPLISHFAARRNTDDALDTILAQIKIVWCLSLLVTATLATLWPVIVVFMFGPAYPLAAAEGVIALTGFPFAMVLTVLTSAFLASSCSIYLLVLGMIQAAVIIAASPALIEAFGLAGYLAVQTLGTLIGLLVAGILFMRRYRCAPSCRWMFPLMALTTTCVALITADLVVAETMATRLSLGGLVLAIAAVVLFQCVFSPAEISRLQIAALSAWHNVRPGGLGNP